MNSHDPYPAQNNTPPRTHGEHRQVEKKRRKREIIIILFCIVGFGGITYLERYISVVLDKLNIQHGFFSKVLFLVMVNIDIVLILILLFLIFRNLVKLILELKRGKLGSRLRIKLVVIFLSFAIIPTVLHFYISTQFINNSIEKYFSINVTQSLQSFRKATQFFYDDAFLRMESWSQNFSKEMTAFNYIVTAENKHFMQLYSKFCRDHDVQMSKIYLKGNPRPIVPIESETLPPDASRINDQEGVRAGLMGKRYDTIIKLKSGELLTHYEPIFMHKRKNAVIGTLVFYQFVRYNWVFHLNKIESIFGDLKPGKNVLKSGYFVLLVMMTLLIVFSAMWLGFYLAREITIPIQQLAEATNQIAEGNLDVKIEIKGKDEIGSLVKSFNKMTRDLRVSQSDLQKAYNVLAKTSEEIEQRRRYMEAVLNNVAAGIVSIGKKGRIQTINKAAANRLQINPKDIIGRNLKDVITKKEHQDIVSEFLEALNTHEKESIKNHVSLKIADKDYLFEVSVEVLREDTKKYLGMVVVFDDMTELVKAQRMAAWREVARRIAHEIKNPLTPVKLSAQRLRRRFLGKFQGEEEKVFDECTKMIVEQVDGLKLLVNEFSKFARLPDTNPKPGNIHDLIEETLALYRENHPNLSFKLRRKSTIPVFNFDGEQLKRVFINLITNAINAISGTGTITIETQLNTVLQIARVSVKDTGRGIPQEIKAKMFEPYFSTKKTGTGLGLAIVSQIIADHHGYVRVEDNRPRGTNMIIEFPVGYQTFSTKKKLEEADS